MLDYFAGSVAAFAYWVFLSAYVTVRPKGAISVMDMFFFMFCLQFGPHSIVMHPFMEDRALIASVYPLYAMGLAFAFTGLAFGLFVAGALTKTREIRLYPLNKSDISEKGGGIVILMAAIYVMLFVAYQGFDISRTASYLNFFRGDSIYTYTELRREIYEDDVGMGLSAVTRQTSSAIFYSVLIYIGIKYRLLRLPAFLMAGILFIVCSMQMNKFPFLYYALLAAMVLFASRCYQTGRFLERAVVFKILAAGLVGVIGLALLYWVQYRDEIEAGIVTSDRIIFRLISRPFAGNHGSLYYWYDVFPDRHDFVGLSSIPLVANLFDVNLVSPTVLVPSYYVGAKTTFQAAYIGGAYASFGFPGILFYSIFVGAWVGVLTRLEKSFDVGWQRVAYLSVVGVNMYFLSSRELHTAMQSGGFVVAPLLMLLVRRWTLANRTRAPASKRTRAYQ